MNISTTFSTTILAILFIASILLSGCDNPASNDDHDEHSDPYGIQFVMNGEIILTYLNGDTDGHFDVEEGTETSLITAEFLDEEGNEIHGEDLDDEYYLNWNIGNTDLAEVEKHDEDGRWSFHIVGKAAGETSIQFLLMHGGNHHDLKTPDLDKNPLELHITQQSQQ